MPPQTPFFSSNKNNISPTDLGFWEDVGNNYARQYKGVLRSFNDTFLLFGNVKAEEDFEWWKHIEGYEDVVQELSSAKNLDHLNYLKQSVDIQRHIRAKAARGSFAPAIVAGIVDPLNVAFALPIFNVGMKAAWASKSAFAFGYETAKIALPFAVTREAIRAPHDPYATGSEITTNVAAETLFSFAFGYGIRGGVNAVMRPKIADGVKKYGDFLFDRNKDPSNINGVKIKQQATKKKRQDGSKVYAYVDNTKKEVIWDKKGLLKQFDEKPWTSPKVKGVTPLPDYLFQKPEDWARFVLHHEKAHVEHPFEKLQTQHMSVNQSRKYTRVDYENEINAIAVEDFTDGFGLKQTAGTKSKFFNFITTAGKRILNNPNIPNEMKKAYVDLFYNASLNLEGNITGSHAIQSAAARAVPYTAMSTRVNKSIKAAYLEELKGYGVPSEILGLDIDAIAVRLNKYGSDAKQYKDFYTNLIHFHIDMMTDPSFNKKLYDKLPDKHKEALSELANFFKDFERDLRDVGKLGDDAGIRKKIKEYTKIIDYHKGEIEKLNKNKGEGQTRANYIASLEKKLKENKKIVNDLIKFKDKNIGKSVTREFFNKKTGRRDFGKLKYTLRMFNEDAAQPQATVRRMQLELQKVKGDKNYLGGEEFNAKVIPHQQAINRITTQKEFLEGQLETTYKNYAFPHYFNKALLIEDEDAREALTNKLAELFSRQGSKKSWDENLEKYILEDASTPKNARNLAEQTVTKILEEPNLINLISRHGRKKHLMHRLLDFPTYELKDWLVLDERVLDSYAMKMGFHVEFGRKMGSMDIDDILDRLTYVMEQQGKLTDEQIAAARSDFLGEYERNAGIHVTDPDAMSQRTVRNLKSITGMTYLGYAGVTSFIDAIGMPLFRYGPKAVFKTAMDAVNGDLPEMIKMGAQLRDAAGEAVELTKPIVQYRHLSDSVKDIQPRITERAIQGLEKVFYRLNVLSQVTSYAKMLDTNLLIPQFYNRIQKIKNNENIDDWIIEDLGRYGIDIKTAKELADKPFYFTERGNAKFDITQWPDATKRDRELKITMLTYLGQHARNTIMNSTSFDKPLMMDGFMYVRMNPVLRALGYQADKRASTANVKLVRLESAYFGIPYQFYNFVFAATNRITMNMFDPNTQNRITGMLSLLGMSYLVLQLKKEDWWFENRDWTEILMRTVDQSGVAGIYTDIAYHAIHSSIAHGGYNDDYGWIKGKYEPSAFDDIFDKSGAMPSMLREWMLSAHELVNGKTEDGLKRGLYNFPLIGIYGMNRDLDSMFHTRY